MEETTSLEEQGESDFLGEMKITMKSKEKST